MTDDSAPTYLFSRFAITARGSRFAIFALVNTSQSSKCSQFKLATKHNTLQRHGVNSKH